jgi:hypothetical protein
MTSSPTARERRLAYLGCAAVCVIWGTTYPFTLRITTAAGLVLLGLAVVRARTLTFGRQKISV